MLQASRMIYGDRKIWKRNHGEPPEISVIMPTYCRGERSLRNSVESVLAQTFENFEFIIIDDGSRDSTFRILEEYYGKDSRIVLIRHEQNCGLPALRVNEGIMEAGGKYIAYQFDDDMYNPDCLEILHAEICKYDGLCLVYGNCEVSIRIDGQHSVVRTLGKEFNYGILMNGNYIANNSVLHHKEIFELVGMYDPHVLTARFSDYDLWLRMARKVPFYWINKNVSKVFAGEEHSLGREIEYRMADTRKYLEIPRDSLLKASVIGEYAVDGFDHCLKYFDDKWIDKLIRQYAIPYRIKAIYYYTHLESFTLNVTRPHKKIIAVTKSDYSTSVDVTIRNFTNRLDSFCYKSFFVNESGLELADPGEYDILALYRTVGNPSLTYKEKHIDKPTIYFMDDNMFKFHELGSEYDYLQPGTVYYENLVKQVSVSHLVASYNPIISEDCREYNSRIISLSTNIPGRFLSGNTRSSSGKIKIAMFSGMARIKVVQNIWPSLERISEKYGDRIEFHFWGINPEMYGTLSSSVFYEPFTHSYDMYVERLQNSQFDFHICPLDSEFDASRSKSPVKFLEGAVAGAVGIFSNVSPYRHLPDLACLKVDKYEDWFEVMDRALTMDIRVRQNMLTYAQKFIVDNYSTESQAKRFLTALDAAELIAKLKGKKIAYFFHESYLGGATLHLFKHALYIKGLGIDVILCLPETQRSIQDLPLLAGGYGLSISYIQYTYHVELVEPNASEIRQAHPVADWLLEHDIGLVHSVTYIPSVGIACKMTGIPHAATLHMFYACKAGPFFLQHNKLIDAIHSSSLKYSRQWSGHLGVEAIRIACPVDPVFFDLFPENCRSQRNGNIKILVSGTLQDRKNQLDAIKAIVLLIDKGYSVELDLIGYHNLRNDYVAECEQVISDKQLSEKIKIHGFTENPEKYYSGHADILLCASVEESMPQTILQAMAAGVLVVSTVVGGVKEVLKDNYSGIIAGGHDEAALCAALERAINLDDTSRKAILTNAFRSVKVIADPDFVFSELVHFYNTAFDNRVANGEPLLLRQMNAKIGPAKSGTSAREERQYEIEMVNRDPDKILVGGKSLIRPREYVVETEFDGWTELKVRVGTHREQCEGDIVVRIYEFGSKDLVREVSLNRVRLDDNQLLAIPFAAIDRSREKKFVVSLAFFPTDSGRGRKTCVYEYARKNSYVQKVCYKLGLWDSYALYGYLKYNI